MYRKYVNISVSFISMQEISYSVTFKLQIVQHAKEHGNRAAERHFGPPPTKMLCCLKALIVKMKILTAALLVRIKIFNGISF